MKMKRIEYLLQNKNSRLLLFLVGTIGGAGVELSRDYKFLLGKFIPRLLSVVIFHSRRVQPRALGKANGKRANALGSKSWILEMH